MEGNNQKEKLIHNNYRINTFFVTYKHYQYYRYQFVIKISCLHFQNHTSYNSKQLEPNNKETLNRLFVFLILEKKNFHLVEKKQKFIFFRQT